MDWFLPAEAYLKRTLIQRLISELVENQCSREISSSDGSDDHQYIENIENGSGIEHLEFNRASKPSHAGEGIEMTLLSGSSFLDPQSFNNPGMVLKDLFEPGTTAGTTSAQCQSFDQRSSDYPFDNAIFSMEVCTYIFLHVHLFFGYHLNILFQHVILSTIKFLTSILSPSAK